MENVFAAALKNESKWTRTENGAVALNTTGEACLDLFSTIGALRRADSIRKRMLFEEAYAEDPLLATKILFYARDIREGLGERGTFRELLHSTAIRHPEAIKANIPLIGLFGRFDDLYSLMDTPLEDDMWSYMGNRLSQDIFALESGKASPSLLAKWIKTPDASSKNTRELGIKTALKLGYSVRDFKRILRRLRKAIDVTEVKMSANNWTGIEYANVPSRAMTLYRSAFGRHDYEGFGKYLASVTKGEAKINASTLYPYDLVERVFIYSWPGCRIAEDPVVEAQWKALPNYVEPGTNAIVIADTSGSMHGRPMDSAIGLAIYFAERNTGAYHNLFMSFSEDSKVHKIKGDTLAEKIRSIDITHWGSNTNLEAAFDQILDIAIKNKINPDEMVRSLIVISDMEIDECTSTSGTWAFYDCMEKKYRDAGYTIPNVIFWNVDSRHDVFHADATRKGVQLVSGQSTTTFKQLVGCVNMTPVEMMLKAINSPRYDVVTIA